ncbi:Vps5-domain-containing protein [Colletotrichum sp. SAR 10_76]|nr:Vps5-domain-containing protein [Colletotrichum sp. SAR 10_76]
MAVKKGATAGRKDEVRSKIKWYAANSLYAATISPCEYSECRAEYPEDTTARAVEKAKSNQISEDIAGKSKGSAGAATVIFISQRCK